MPKPLTRFERECVVASIESMLEQMYSAPEAIGREDLERNGEAGLRRALDKLRVRRRKRSK